MTTDEAVSALETAFQVEVEYRHGIYNGTTVQQEYIRRAAECLTNKGQKFGIFMVGGPGNGKTTLMKAIQSLVTTLKMKNEYNERMYVVFTTAKEIERLCQENYTGFKRLCDKPLLAIDDFGAENVDVKVYGNVPLLRFRLLGCGIGTSILALCDAFAEDVIPIGVYAAPLLVEARRFFCGYWPRLKRQVGFRTLDNGVAYGVQVNVIPVRPA